MDQRRTPQLPCRSSWTLCGRGRQVDRPVWCESWLVTAVGLSTCTQPGVHLQETDTVTRTYIRLASHAAIQGTLSSGLLVRSLKQTIILNS
ncbi:hypothetical protein GUJ93_ZPchr0003g17678 [Zizania palustris]|uniref:Uncharacterized protein n=1 Tax=Zizania palustris TaxID=103762 RepID=A0A8J5S9S9_ZIZPA|nr:hypothetical protein GUJ93_ZPchr0003g17678 [Zizania palustris]